MTVCTDLGRGPEGQSWQQTPFLCHMGNAALSTKHRRAAQNWRWLQSQSHNFSDVKTVPKSGLCSWAQLQLLISFFFLCFFRWVCIFSRRTWCCFPVTSCSILRHNQKENRNRINYSLMGGGNNWIWINASTVNTFLTSFGGSSQNTRELISVALANKFLYSPCKPWVHIVGGNHCLTSVAKLCLKFCLCCYEAFDCAMWGVKLKTMFYHYLKHWHKVVLGEK